jgi:hypothetical protein
MSTWLCGRLCLLAACAAAGCAPGDFDALAHPHEQGESAAQCDEDPADMLCEAGGGEPASEQDAEPEQDAEAETAPPLDAEVDACSTCEDAALSDAGRDAQVCDACSSALQDAMACADAACMHDAGPCQGAASVCAAGQKQTQQQACGACNTGTQTRTRSCAADGCSWGGWSAWGACGGVSAPCTPNQTTGCENGDECGHRVCSASCSWGACTPKVSNGCLRIGPGHTDQGSNYQCCSSGHWQFCLPDCHWSTDCSACGASSCEC